MLDENGKLPKAKQALFADAVATTTGALLGTSTVTAYVESAAGIGEGGKNWFNSSYNRYIILIIIILSPVFTAIPTQATAPVLIIVWL